MKSIFYEDLEIGRRFESESYTIHLDEAVDFARRYDPQYFHIDEEAARKGFWGQLVVSGWQTAAVTMRLKTTSELMNVSGGLIGMGIDHIRWPKAVLPGDTLKAAITITGKRLSRSRPDKGIVKYKVETFNQNGELVMEMETAVLVPRRSGG